MSDSNFDVIVVGAGAAGATAARDLTEAGKKVLILEARDRIGGRTYSRPYTEEGGGEKQIDLGAQYIMSWTHKHVMREMERYGIEVEILEEPTKYVWGLGGEEVTGFPLDLEEIQGFEQAIYQIKKDSYRMEVGKPLPDDVGELDISWSDYLDQFELGPKARDLISVFAELLVSGDEKQLSALHQIWAIAGLENSPWMYFAGIGEAVKGGSMGIAEALIADAGAELRLETPVASVSHSDDGVVVTTTTGETFEAAAAVVATPSNCWEDIEFTPALGEQKQKFSDEKHLSRAHKVLMLVEEGPEETFAIGRNADTFTALIFEGKAEGGSLYVGFMIEKSGDENDKYDFTDNIELAEKLLQAQIPGAKVISIEYHNWLTDDYAKGTHMAHRAGKMIEYWNVVQEGQGRLSFAGGDISPGWGGWIDGAIESGDRAAKRTLEILDRAASTVSS